MLVREETREYSYIPTGDTNQEIYELMKAMNLAKKPEEHFMLICHNEKGVITDIYECSHGIVETCPASPREILKRALISNASKITVVHNHTSGDSTPSNQDMKLTDRLKEACKILEIEFLDHLVIGDKEFYSIKEDKKHFEEERRE